MRFIRTKDVLRMLGVSRTTVWRMVRAGAFPRRVTISARASGHVLEEVEASMEERADRNPAGLDLLASQAAHTDPAAEPGPSVVRANPPSAIGSPSPPHGGRRRQGLG